MNDLAKRLDALDIELGEIFGALWLLAQLRATESLRGELCPKCRRKETRARERPGWRDAFARWDETPGVTAARRYLQDLRETLTHNACQTCGSAVLRLRADARYCSAPCRQAGYRARRRIVAVSA